MYISCDNAKKYVENNKTLDLDWKIF